MLALLFFFFTPHTYQFLNMYAVAKLGINSKLINVVVFVAVVLRVDEVVGVHITSF